MSSTTADPQTLLATLESLLDALRARGLAGAEPVRFRYAQALLRRAASQSPAVRARLHARLHERLQAWLAEAEVRNDPATEIPGTAAPARGATAATPRTAASASTSTSTSMAASAETGRPADQAWRSLLATLEVAPSPWRASPAATAPGPLPARAGTPSAGSAPARPALTPPAPPALRSVRRFQGTYVRLRAEQRLVQSRQRVPDQAGPLNANRLLHLALQQMGDTAPGYLQRFMTYVEGLLWLDAARLPTPPGAPAAPPAPRRARKRG